MKTHEPPKSTRATPHIATPAAIPSPGLMPSARMPSQPVAVSSVIGSPEDPLALGKTETVWPSRPYNSPRHSISGRRKSVQVMDEGQADLAAITSRPPTRPTSMDLRSEMPSIHSASLEVPKIGETGKTTIGSSVASIKSGTVGGGPTNGGNLEVPKIGEMEKPSNGSSVATIKSGTLEGGPTYEGSLEGSKIGETEITTIPSSVASIKSGAVGGAPTAEASDESRDMERFYNATKGIN